MDQFHNLLKMIEKLNHPNHFLSAFVPIISMIQTDLSLVIILPLMLKWLHAHLQCVLFPLLYQTHLVHSDMDYSLKTDITFIIHQASIITTSS